jgi:Fe-S-cluster-containing dehydrogenase component
MAGEIKIDPEKCTGCRICEFACNYHHDREFSAIGASLLLSRDEKKNYYWICLQLVLLSPEMKAEDMVDLLKLCPSWEELSVSRVGEIVQSMIVSSLKSREGKEDIHRSLKPEGFDQARAKLKERFA